MTEEEVMTRWSERRHAYTHHGHAYGDNCGDDIHWCLTVFMGRIVEAKYMTKACTLTTGIADYMAEHITGMLVSDVRTVDPFSFIDFDVSPGRQDCVTLPKEALDAALHF